VVNFILVIQLTSHHDGGHLPTEDYKLVTELRLVTTKYDEISNAEDSDPRFVIVNFVPSVSGTSVCDWPLSAPTKLSSAVIQEKLALLRLALWESASYKGVAAPFQGFMKAKCQRPRVLSGHMVLQH
jgi:hypothetical protein